MRLLNRVKKFLELIFFNTNAVIIFFARYPEEQYLQDGFYQRISAIDTIFDGHIRFYAVAESIRSVLPLVDSPKDGVFRLFFNPRNPLHLLIWLCLVVKARFLYIHSIWRFERKIVALLIKSKLKRVILDIHGVAPEEMSLYGQEELANRLEGYERTYLPFVDYLVVVTREMGEHYVEKYGLSADKIVYLPVFRSFKQNLDLGKKQPARYVYAGGLQQWQKIDLMLSSIESFKGEGDFRILSRELEGLKEEVAKYNIQQKLVLDCLGGAALEEMYETCSYGFVLRDPIVVNKVACPTKLVEYLEYGIVPIMSYPGIGGFEKMGLKYLNLSDFVSGKTLTSEQYTLVVQANFEILSVLRNDIQRGQSRLREIVGA